MLNRARLDQRSENGPRLLLADHHHEIEAACDALRVSICIDDPLDLVACYRRFEHAVLEHVQAEEDVILPAYAHYVPDDAAAIRATHEQLRRRLTRLAVEVELHCVRAESLEQLMRMLRSHAAHEDCGMYPWAQVHLPPDSKLELFRRIRDSIRMLALVPKRSAERNAARSVNE